MTYPYHTTYARVDRDYDNGGFTLREPRPGESVAFGLEIIPPHNYSNWSTLTEYARDAVRDQLEYMAQTYEIDPSVDAGHEIADRFTGKDWPQQIADGLVPHNDYHRVLLTAECPDILDYERDAQDYAGPDDRLHDLIGTMIHLALTDYVVDIMGDVIGEFISDSEGDSE